MPFSLSKISSYSIAELVDYVLTCSTTLPQLYKSGLFGRKRIRLERALAIRDDEDWRRATEQNTREAYEEYLSVYDKKHPYYVGLHLAEATEKIVELNAKSSELQIEVNPEFYRNLFTENNGGEEKKAPEKKDTLVLQKYKKFIIAAGAIVILLMSVVIGIYAGRMPAQSLTDEEINLIIAERADSLKTRLFNDFYLVPTLAEDIGSDLFTRQEVYARYDSLVDIGAVRYNIVTKSGEFLQVPGADKGIDSLCLQKFPFIEYIDNDGLRRKVALLNGEVCYFLGNCGKRDNLELYIVCNNNDRYGVINENGTIFRDLEHEKISINNLGGFTVTNHDQSVVYNSNGSEYTPTTETPTAESPAAPTLETWYSFYDNRYGLYGYKDCNDKIKIKAQFKDFFSHNFTGQAVWVKLNDKYVLINRAGKPIRSFDLVENYYSQSGIMWVKENDKFGIYDVGKQEMVVPTVFESIKSSGVNIDLIPAKKDGKWGYVRRGGSTAIDFKFKEARAFSSNPKVAVVKEDDDSIRYINAYGTPKFSSKYYDAASMTPNGAVVRRAPESYGYINTEGKLLAGWYKKIGGKYVHHRMYVCEDSLVGFTDDNCNLVIPCMFDADTTPEFGETSHLARVKYQGIEWYINVNGAFCYPASSQLKPSDQDIRAQIAEQQVKELEEQAQREAEENNEKENQRPDSRNRNRNKKIYD